MFVVIGIFYIFNSWTDVIMVFLNVQTDFWCSVPAHLKDIMSIEEWKQQSGQTESSCAIYNVTYPMELRSLPLYTPKVPCESFSFDTSQFTLTVTSEWSLVCSEAYKVGLAQTVYYFGQMFGIIIFGILSDTFGRKRMFVPLTCVMGIFGIMGAYVGTYEQYLIIRFVIALTKMGKYRLGLP
ncbi:organic cation transporter protein-like [Tigriopus californicus]|nr:organic cation transporter protein-like [Tigriopus californicus]